MLKQNYLTKCLFIVMIVAVFCCGCIGVFSVFGDSLTADGEIAPAAVVNEYGFAGGDGKTKETAFLIETAEQLDNIRHYPFDPEASDSGNGIYIGYYFKIIADIDLKAFIESKTEWGDEGWLPIGKMYDGHNAAEPFYGVVDGGGYTISGLYINRTAAALFGAAQASFCKLKIVIDQKGIIGSAYAAGLVAETLQDGVNSYEIYRCSVSGSISLANSTENFMKNLCGGIIAYADFVTLSECYFSGTLTASNPSGEDDVFGGIAGTIVSGKLINSYSEAEFVRKYDTQQIAGGLIGSTSGGYMFGGGGIEIKHCYVKARAQKEIGAIIGPGEPSLTVDNVYYNSDAPVLANAPSNPEFYPLSSADMKKAASYEHWDFKNVWTINEGKAPPVLQYFFGKYPETFPVWAIAVITVGGAVIALIVAFAVYWFAVKKRTFAALGAAIAKPFTKTVIQKETVFVEKETQVFIESEKPVAPLPKTLTAREHEIAVALLKGKSYKEICEELFISSSTVKTHIKNIYEKTACKSRAAFSAMYHGNK